MESKIKSLKKWSLQNLHMPKHLNYRSMHKNLYMQEGNFVKTFFIKFESCAKIISRIDSWL